MNDLALKVINSIKQDIDDNNVSIEKHKLLLDFYIKYKAADENKQLDFLEQDFSNTDIKRFITLGWYINFLYENKID